MSIINLTNFKSEICVDESGVIEIKKLMSSRVLKWLKNWKKKEAITTFPELWILKGTIEKYDYLKSLE